MAAPVFTLAAARAAGLSKDEVYRRVAAGLLERVGRGVYVDPEAVDPAFAAQAGATALQPRATMCLTSALVYHQLSDAVPFAVDIALPRGVRHPAGFEHVVWHSFDLGTFDVGRAPVRLDDLTLWVYSPERTIVDCFRLGHREGVDQAHIALRRWLRQPGSAPAGLLETVRSFPRVQARIRQALDVLL